MNKKHKIKEILEKYGFIYLTEPSEDKDEITVNEVLQEALEEAMAFSEHQTLRRVIEMIDKEFEQFLLMDWSGEDEVYSEIERLKGFVVKSLSSLTSLMKDELGK